MSIALYAGSFDPITNGHLDIIKSGSEIFEKLIIGVAINSQKKYLLPTDKRIQLVEEATKEFSNIEIYPIDGLTADFAKVHKVNIFLRGLRNTVDFEYEKELAFFNYSLNNSIKTVFLMSKPEYSYISASGVKELIENNADISNFVPKCVQNYLSKV